MAAVSSYPIAHLSEPKHNQIITIFILFERKVDGRPAVSECFQKQSLVSPLPIGNTGIEKVHGGSSKYEGQAYEGMNDAGFLDSEFVGSLSTTSNQAPIKSQIPQTS
ncbi:hypothetical protein Tco_1410500 [Tanacetum coccineum]